MRGRLWTNQLPVGLAAWSGSLRTRASSPWCRRDVTGCSDPRNLGRRRRSRGRTGSWRHRLRRSLQPNRDAACSGKVTVTAGNTAGTRHLDIDAWSSQCQRRTVGHTNVTQRLFFQLSFLFGILDRLLVANKVKVWPRCYFGFLPRQSKAQILAIRRSSSSSTGTDSMKKLLYTFIEE